jgi:hypothetical protein
VAEVLCRADNGTQTAGFSAFDFNNRFCRIRKITLPDFTVRACASNKLVGTDHHVTDSTPECAQFCVLLQREDLCTVPARSPDTRFVPHSLPSNVVP